MNGQNNPFNINRNPRKVSKKSGQSLSDFNMEKDNEKEKDLNQKTVKNNSLNSEQMNNNPYNHKIDTVNMPQAPISGSENNDEEINPGMIKAEASKQHNILKGDEEEQQLSFSKALGGGMKNPADAFIKEEDSTVEKITSVDGKDNKYHNPDDTAKEKKNIRRIIMLIICIGLVIEIGVLIIGTIVKNNKTTTVVCTNSNDYDYYKATVKSERKYTLKQDKIIKLEEETNYIFSDSAEYLKYKEEHMNPPYQNIKGRNVMNSINDDTLTYTEKIVYDYDVLLKNNKNTSQEKERITIETNDEQDTINLVNTTAEKIQTYYSDTYTCK